MTAGCSAAFHTYYELVTSGPVAEFQPSATDYLRLRRLLVSVLSYSANNTLVLGIGVPAASGTGRSGAGLLQEDAGDTQAVPSINIFTDWTIPPTAPTRFYRRVSTSVVSTSGSLLSFDLAGGLGLSPGGSLVLWAISEGGTTPLLYDISVEFDG